MSKVGKEGHNGHFRNCLNELNDKTRNSICLLKCQKGEKRELEQGRCRGV